MTTTESQPTRRSVPTVTFTDAEAGAQTFAGSEDRTFKYYTPRRRKASQYEDVTVEVQPDPRHYLSQGWLYAFADGTAGFPMEWTRLKAWGQDEHPPPRRTPGSGGAGYPWPATGWHEFRDPNEEWELTLYRYNADVVRQMTRNIEVARQTKAFDQWGLNWIRFVEQHVGAWMHVEYGLGMYVFVDAQRAAPTNMHNNAISVNGMHKMRFAQDLALYNLALSDEIAEFDGRAHLETWNKATAWQGVRECVERLTADRGLGGGGVLHQCGLRTPHRGAVPQPPGDAGVGRQRRLRAPPRSSGPASTTTPSAICGTPRRCSNRCRTTASSGRTTER